MIHEEPKRKGSWWENVAIVLLAAGLIYVIVSNARSKAEVPDPHPQFDVEVYHV